MRNSDFAQLESALQAQKTPLEQGVQYLAETDTTTAATGTGTDNVAVTTGAEALAPS